jgi:integrase
VQMLVASAKGDLSIKIDIIQQTGLRPVEIQGEKGLQVCNVHPDHNTITARITKGCNQRPPLSITPELLTRIQTYIRKHDLKNDDILFTGQAKNFGKAFRHFRNRLAKKLNDPTIHNIRLYDLRHYYCTKQLKRTQNTEIVRQLMGHKQLNTTQKYLHLLGYGNAEWIVEGTDDKERAKQLLKEDFQYQLTTPDGTMIFRKPK